MKHLPSGIAPKWYRRMAFWKVLTAILAPIAGGELIVFFRDVHLPTEVHVFIGCCAIVSLYVKTFVKDDDGDGLID